MIRVNDDVGLDGTIGTGAQVWRSTFNHIPPLLSSATFSTYVQTPSKSSKMTTTMPSALVLIADGTEEMEL